MLPEARRLRETNRRRPILLWLVAILALCAGCARVAPLGSGEPAWFPDSRRLLYVVTSGDRTEVFEYDLANGEAHRIPLKVSGRPYSPNVSPDGSRIAFAVATGSETIRSDIYVADRDGGHLSRVFSNGNHNSAPVFSAGGEAVMFVEARAFESYSPIAQPHLHRMDLVAVDLNSRRQTDLTHDQSYEVSHLVVDPTDGTVVVRMPGEMDSRKGCPLDTLQKFDWSSGALENPRELRPDLSAFLQNDAFSIAYRNYYPWQDIGSVSFDSHGLMYFTWPTSDTPGGDYNYETYRWDPKSDRTERLTSLRRMVSEVSASPDGKWLAVQLETRVGLAWGPLMDTENGLAIGWMSPPPQLVLYSVQTGELRPVPIPPLGEKDS